MLSGNQALQDLAVLFLLICSFLLTLHSINHRYGGDDIILMLVW